MSKKHDKLEETIICQAVLAQGAHFSSHSSSLQVQAGQPFCNLSIYISSYAPCFTCLLPNFDIQLAV